uniref:Uncharacterized protein n=1 Tax=Anagyrus vladimiri reovirus TaxID=2992174 RepID=A0A9E7VEL8_9REOV|nr:hypothetical protein [Anagyrus vladimiri reovirus]
MDALFEQYTLVGEYFLTNYAAYSPEELDDEQRQLPVPRIPMLRVSVIDVCRNETIQRNLRRELNDGRLKADDYLFTPNILFGNVFDFYTNFLVTIHRPLSIVGYDVDETLVTYQKNIRLQELFGESTTPSIGTIDQELDDGVSTHSEEINQVNVEMSEEEFIRQFIYDGIQFQFDTMFRILNGKVVYTVDELFRCFNLIPKDVGRKLQLPLPRCASFTKTYLQDGRVRSSREYNEMLVAVVDGGDSSRVERELSFTLRKILKGDMYVKAKSRLITIKPVQCRRVMNVETRAAFHINGVLLASIVLLYENKLNPRVCNMSYEIITSYLIGRGGYMGLDTQFYTIYKNQRYELNLSEIFKTFLEIDWVLVWWNYLSNIETREVNSYIQLWCIVLILRSGDMKRLNDRVDNSAIRITNPNSFKEFEKGAVLTRDEFLEEFNKILIRPQNPKSGKSPQVTYMFPPGLGSVDADMLVCQDVRQTRLLMYFTAAMLENMYTPLEIVRMFNLLDA